MQIANEFHAAKMPQSPAPAAPPVDAVIAWVDGADPKHAEKRARFSEGSPERLAGAKPTRFASLDEIIYCTLSILKFAPFFRRIFIVTDDQIPPIFDAVRTHFPEQIDKIEIVDHKMLFRDHEHALPTFNSLSIETMLHRIPDLSERFVYFNDDFFLVRPATAEDWFRGEKTRIDGRWLGRKFRVLETLSQGIQDLLWIPEGRRRIGSKAGQLLSAQMVDFNDDFFYTSHTPYARRKSVLEAYFAAHPDALEANIAHRFRSRAQFVPQSLNNHLEIQAGNAEITIEQREVYTRAGASSLRKAQKKVAKVDTVSTVKFFCMQSLDEAKPSVRDFYISWLCNLTASDKGQRPDNTLPS